MKTIKNNKQENKYPAFTDMDCCCTLGRAKDKIVVNRIFRKSKRVGSVNVELLKNLIKHLDNDDVIGIYIDKDKKLMPLHSHRWMVAPRISIDKRDVIEDIKEGR